MPLARATKIIAALLIGLFLSVPHVALGQSLFEANDLNQQVIELYKQGREQAESLRIACAQAHLVNPKNGKVMGAGDDDLSARDFTRSRDVPRLGNFAGSYRVLLSANAEPLPTMQN